MSKVIDMPVQLGQRVREVMEAALTLAKASGNEVRVHVNGVILQTRPGLSIDEWMREYEQPTAKEVLQARESRALYAAAVQKEQAELKVLMATLPYALQAQPELVAWVGKLSLLESIDLKDVRAEIITALRGAGYQADDATDGPPRTSEAAARYIIGQVLDQLIRGTPLHPMLGTRFVAEYTAMRNAGQ